MGVIVVTPNPDRMSSQVRTDTGHVRPNFVAESAILKQRSTLPGAEDEVVEKLLVARHGWPSINVSPAGL